MSRIRTLARFATGTTFAALPAEVVAKAKELARHSWGVQLAASTLPWSSLVHRVAAAEGGTPESTVVNHGGKIPAAGAAFVNGSFAHGFELDDNHARTGVKVGCVAVPTALAIGERHRSDGRDVITALAVGCELMVRVGLAIRHGRTRRGGHATGTAGALGAAAVVAVLSGFDEDTCAQALAGAARHVIGSTEAPPQGRGHLKRTFGGAAAAGGIRAALLAEAGLTGPESMLDDGCGLFRAFDVDTESAAALTRDLGRTWEFLDAHYKIYAQDGYIQPMSEALERIRVSHDFAVEEVDEVVVGTNSHAYHDIVGRIRDPRDLTDAQFSANFSVALHLVTGGAGIDEYTPDNLHDPAIRALSERVRLHIDDDIEQDFQATRPRGARVTVRLRSGRSLQATVRNLREQTPAELDEKFLRLSARVLSQPARERLLADTHRLQENSDITSIARQLVRD
ncbi:MmgE/PrpD family protein [Actinophytocola sp.]|uniref:MmgE/PrpD family protein n=1 Tax=Actinophytocola sp. TaxID=1872138 RepID=UPI003D6BE788